MRNQLGRRRSFLGVSPEHPFNQLLELLGVGPHREIDVVIPQRPPPLPLPRDHYLGHRHLIERDPEAEDIRREPKDAVQELRRHVLVVALARRDLVPGAVREAKVAHLDALPPVAEEEVVGLEVEVHGLVAVEVVDALEDVVGVAEDLLLAQPLVLRPELLQVLHERLLAQLRQDPYLAV